MPITIRHNFDPSKFKWLWAKYVKDGNIEKHCTACMIGSYSRKFSGTTNRKLLEQTTLVMDEVPDGQYEAIYFCGVLKKGYLSQNPLSNNYPHNVHFAVRPADGETDVWNFENWHVEIENGKLERIPETYELKEKFFCAPYNPHYYTCRIFRWMVGHFYPEELLDVTYGYPEVVYDLEKKSGTNLHELFSNIRKNGFEAAKGYFEDREHETWYFNDLIDEYKDTVPGARIINRLTFAFNHKLFSRAKFAESVSERASTGGADYMENGHCIRFMHNGVEIDFIKLDILWQLFETGIEDYLDLVATYQPRRFIHIKRLGEN